MNRSGPTVEVAQGKLGKINRVPAIVDRIQFLLSSQGGEDVGGDDADAEEDAGGG
jgi:hypothetical protein